MKVQGYIKLVNYQPSEIIELESKRVWLTDVFTCRFLTSMLEVKLEGIFCKWIDQQ